jgi:hypothetical protein
MFDREALRKYTRSRKSTPTTEDLLGSVQKSGVGMDENFSRLGAAYFVPNTFLRMSVVRATGFARMFASSFAI